MIGGGYSSGSKMSDKRLYQTRVGHNSIRLKLFTYFFKSDTCCITYSSLFLIARKLVVAGNWVSNRRDGGLRMTYYLELCRTAFVLLAPNQDQSDRVAVSPFDLP